MGGDTFDEADHPRASDGKFDSGGGGGGGDAKAATNQDTHGKMDERGDKAGLHRDVPQLKHDQRVQTVRGPSAGERAKNAAIMYGGGSKQHLAALKKVGGKK